MQNTSGLPAGIRAPERGVQPMQGGSLKGTMTSDQYYGQGGQAPAAGARTMGAPMRPVEYDPEKKKAMLQMLAQGVDPNKLRYIHVMHGYDEAEANDAIDTFNRITGKTPEVNPEQDQQNQYDEGASKWATLINNKQATWADAEAAGYDRDTVAGALVDMPTAEEEEEQKLKKLENEEVQGNIALIDKLLEDDKYGAISGPVQTGVIPFTEAKQTAALYDQLKGKISLDARKALKGQGTITDFEFKILGEAASALNRGMSEKAMKETLQEIKDVFEGKLKDPNKQDESTGGQTGGNMITAPDGQQIIITD